MNDVRRIDPEPVTIYLALMATFSASITALNYVKTHRRMVPSRVRARIVDDINQLQEDVGHIREDLKTIENIFSSAEYIRDSMIRLGNGVLLSYPDFRRYERASGRIFRTLEILHKRCLRLERNAARYEFLDMGAPTGQIGEAGEIFTSLMATQNLTQEETWSQLDRIAVLIDQACAVIREQIYYE